MKTGDNVKLIGHGATGKIMGCRWLCGSSSEPLHKEFQVRYDDGDLIPRMDWHKPEHLELLPTLPFGSVTVNSSCEHEWTFYEGFIDQYEYCTKCDVKKGSPICY